MISGDSAKVIKVRQITHLSPYGLGTILKRYYDESPLEGEKMVENLHLQAITLHDLHTD